MQELSHKEFLALLRGYGTGVHCANYGGFYTAGDFYGEKFFLDRGCVIYQNELDWLDTRHIALNIHQIAPDADIDAVISDWRAKAAESASGTEKLELRVYAFVVLSGRIPLGELPPEKEHVRGFRCFTRRGEHLGPDPRVRPLAPSDADMVLAACEEHRHGDTEHGKIRAEKMLEIMTAFKQDGIDANKHIFGIFDGGGFVGVAVSAYIRELDIAWLQEIYILPHFRMKGYGKALVLSALADFPDSKWLYQVARDNAPSIALARSLGFTLEGAGLIVS